MLGGSLARRRQPGQAAWVRVGFAKKQQRSMQINLSKPVGKIPAVEAIMHTSSWRPPTPRWAASHLGQVKSTACRAVQTGSRWLSHTVRPAR